MSVILYFDLIFSSLPWGQQINKGLGSGVKHTNLQITAQSLTSCVIVESYLIFFGLSFFIWKSDIVMRPQINRPKAKQREFIPYGQIPQISRGGRGAEPAQVSEAAVQLPSRVCLIAAPWLQQAGLLSSTAFQSVFLCMSIESVVKDKRHTFLNIDVKETLVQKGSKEVNSEGISIVSDVRRPLGLFARICLG